MKNILITLSDFIISKLYDKSIDDSEKLKSIAKYTYFLKQPLNTGMFIAFNEKGNILNKPLFFDKFMRFGVSTPNMNESQMMSCLEYNEANQYILFDGFMNVDTRKEGMFYFALKQSHRTSQIDHIMNDSYGLYFYDSNNEISRLNIVEDLLKFSELRLTESALKEIGIIKQ